jgi:ketosteroid isomerase-like protein
MRAVAVRLTPFALLLFSAVGSVMQPPRPEDADEREIVALEKAWADAGPARDVPAYERVLADDFIGQWADGSSSNKAETIESLRTSDHYDDITPLGKLNVRVFNGTAVVNGRFSERATSGGKDLTGEYTFTNVWAKRNGRWQCVAFQSTRYSTKGR